VLGKSSDWRVEEAPNDGGIQEKSELLAGRIGEGNEVIRRRGVKA